MQQFISRSLDELVEFQKKNVRKQPKGPFRGIQKNKVNTNLPLNQQKKPFNRFNRSQKKGFSSSSDKNFSSSSLSNFLNTPLDEVSKYVKKQQNSQNRKNPLNSSSSNQFSSNPTNSAFSNSNSQFPTDKLQQAQNEKMTQQQQTFQSTKGRGSTGFFRNKGRNSARGRFGQNPSFLKKTNKNNSYNVYSNSQSAKNNTGAFRNNLRNTRRPYQKFFNSNIAQASQQAGNQKKTNNNSELLQKTDLQNSSSNFQRGGPNRRVKISRGGMHFGNQNRRFLITRRRASGFLMNNKSILNRGGFLRAKSKNSNILVGRKMIRQKRILGTQNAALQQSAINRKKAVKLQPKNRLASKKKVFRVKNNNNNNNNNSFQTTDEELNNFVTEKDQLQKPSAFIRRKSFFNTSLNRSRFNKKITVPTTFVHNNNYYSTYNTQNKKTSEYNTNNNNNNNNTQQQPPHNINTSYNNNQSYQQDNKNYFDTQMISKIRIMASLDKTPDPLPAQQYMITSPPSQI